MWDYRDTVTAVLKRYIGGKTLFTAGVFDSLQLNVLQDSYNLSLLMILKHVK